MICITYYIRWKTGKFELLTNPENSWPARSVCDMMYVDACDSNIITLGGSYSPSIPYMDLSGFSINIIDEDGHTCVWFDN